MKWIRYFLFLLVFVLYTCAHQVPPSGGPEDKTPPSIVATVPDNGAVRVARDLRVEFEFSERIDRDSFPGAIFVSPDPGGELKFKFRKRRAIVVFPRPLLPDRTYVITLGTDLKDSHGISMANSFTLAFSTGDSLDHGEISGKVYDDKPQGVAIWAYILPDSADTLNIDPRQRAGDYQTQAGQSGEYRIPYISPGGYRIFAVRDQAKNGVYDAGEDDIGLPFRDVAIDRQNPLATGINFRLTREDTTAPALTSASMPHHAMLEVRLDEIVTARDTTWPRHFTLMNRQKQDTIAIYQGARFALDPKLFYLQTAPVDEPTDLRLLAHGLTDLSGNALDTAYAYVDFSASPWPDTVAPRILRISPQDSARDVPLNAPVRLIFNEWMQQPDSAVGLAILDTADQSVAGSLKWQNPFELVFQPDSAWQSRTRYRIRFEKTQLLDLAGNALFDTLGTRIFTSLNKDTLAAIAGELILQATTHDTVPIFLTARQVKKGSTPYTLRLPGPGPYEFSDILPGIYLIEGFLDRNRNDKFDFGQLEPFEPAEFFFVYPDSIKVRSRWPNVGNDIVIKLP